MIKYFENLYFIVLALIVNLSFSSCTNNENSLGSLIRTHKVNEYTTCEEETHQKEMFIDVYEKGIRLGDSDSYSDLPFVNGDSSKVKIQGSEMMTVWAKDGLLLVNLDCTLTFGFNQH